MPIPQYSVLKGRSVDKRLAIQANPHYQVHVVDNENDYRISINVLSSVEDKRHPELSWVEYVIVPDFQHPLLDELADLSTGMHRLDSRPGGIALDFIRQNLFNRSQMKPLDFDIPGENNDLNEFLDFYISQAIADERALVYAFGSRWGPETKRDKIFGFLPGNGIHNIHMNQGNSAGYRRDDGVWQDGALLIQFPRTARWVGIFIKFQSQGWHTDDKHGHTIKAGPGEIDTDMVIHDEPDLVVRIVAALVNPAGDDPGHETVTLLNTTRRTVDLSGWALSNKFKEKYVLRNRQIGPGDTLTIKLPAEVPLSNDGGIITLLNRQGLKVHGVAYTRGQAARQGWTITF